MENISWPCWKGKLYYDDYCYEWYRFIGGNFMFYYHKEYPEDWVVYIDYLIYAGNLCTLVLVMDNLYYLFCELDICDRGDILNLFTKRSQM